MTFSFYRIMPFGCAGLIMTAVSLDMLRPAQAATATTTFNVTATVLASCSVTAENLSFGDYTPSNTSPLLASSDIDVTCTNGTDYTVSLDGGSVANDVTARQMSDGTHALNYELFTSSAYSAPWGDGTGSTIAVAGTGDGAAQALTVHGRIPAQQYVTDSQYADQITVTVGY